jgi:hypothetical protein
MSEMLVREALIFSGAVLGAIWGYELGRRVERRRWKESLSGELEALRSKFIALLSELNRFRN